MEQSRICPCCKKEDMVIDIEYGLPAELDEAIGKQERGEIKLGGCLILQGAHQPIFYCKRDKLEFGDLDLVEGMF